MTIRPIICTAESVRAILAGLKTQTRRVMNPQPADDVELSRAHKITRAVIGKRTGELEPGPEIFGVETPDGERTWKSPFAPGDVLWVKEGFAIFRNNEIGFRADADVFGRVFVNGSPRKPEKWTSPLYLPRNRARLWLEVEWVRAERLRDITDRDAFAEGVGPKCAFEAYPSWRSEYARVWDRIHRKSHSSMQWAGNPRVWVVGFKKIEKTVTP